MLQQSQQPLTQKTVNLDMSDKKNLKDIKKESQVKIEQTEIDNSSDNLQSDNDTTKYNSNKKKWWS